MDTPRLASAAAALRHVFVRDLLLQASIGVHPHEQTATQRVRLNIDLAVEDDGARHLSRGAVGRDELSRVVDYERIAQTARRIVGAGHVRLVETLAERIAEACLEDPRVVVARVRAEKLDVFPDVGAVGVEVERRRRNLSTR
jgi:dihydroneopterin aldolase